MMKTLLLFFLMLLSPFAVIAQQAINIDNIEIVRDEYGVPHIFSKTNAEAIYGIAWAQCEDNFQMMQDQIAMAKGLGGRFLGKEGAAADYICEIFQLADFVAANYERDIDAEMHSYLSAYASAQNRYAELHPEKVKHKALYPINERDLLTVYLLAFQMTHSTLAELGRFLVDEFDYQTLDSGSRGSNSMAYSPKITSDGKAYLVGNPHQPVNSIGNFWEFSVHSQEGYEMFGVTFASGGLFAVIGTNRNLGWSHTMNYQNSADIYKLEMHPTKKHHYKYDGEWIPLERRKAKLKVKVGPVVVPVRKEYFISKYGPTLKKKSGFYSYKSFVKYNLKAPEQWFKMGSAKNMDEFMDALSVQGLPNQTITYADKDMNIYHLSNFAHPYRDDQYDWSQVCQGNSTILPGNTSETNWSQDTKVPISALPQVSNPECGYVFNTNNTPYNMTAAEENPKPKDFPKHFGILSSNNMRSKSFERQIAQMDKVSFEDVKSIRESIVVDKFDMSFRSCMNCGDIPALLASHPEMAAIKDIFDRWNGAYEPTNRQATIFSVVAVYLVKYIETNFGNEDKAIPEAVIIDSFQKASKFLKRHYGQLEVELGSVQVAKRFGLSLPMYGSGNTLAASGFKMTKKGKLELEVGDSYIIYARYGSDGLEDLETINAFGNSTEEGHPHSLSQAEMYVNMETKKVVLDLEKLRKSGKIYKPR